MLEIVGVDDLVLARDVFESLEGVAVFALLLCEHAKPFHIKLADRSLFIYVLPVDILLDQLLVQLVFVDLRGLLSLVQELFLVLIILQEQLVDGPF